MAVTVKVNCPAAVGVSLMTPVVLSIDNHVGAPARLKVGAGSPFAVTVNVPGLPKVNVVVGPLVMAGACATVRIKSLPPELPLSSGEAHAVHYPSSAAPTRTRLAIADPDAERIVVCSLLHITSIELLQTAASQGGYRLEAG